MTFNLIYDISKSKEIEEKARSTQKLIVDDANGVEGVKVTQSDSAKELKITIEVDLKKFNYGLSNSVAVHIQHLYKKTWIPFTEIQVHIDYFTSLNPSSKIFFLDSSKL